MFTTVLVLWRPSLSGVYIHCMICVCVLFLHLGKVRPSFSVYLCFAMYSILGWGKPFGDPLLYQKAETWSGSCEDEVSFWMVVGTETTTADVSLGSCYQRLHVSRFVGRSPVFLPFLKCLLTSRFFYTISRFSGEILV